MQQGFAYVTPPLVAVFLLGVFGRRIGATAAYRATITGHMVSAAWFIATQCGWLNLHFTLVAGVLLLVTLLAAMLWQWLLGDAPAASQLAAVATGQHERAPLGVRRASMVLTLLVAALLVAFW